MKKLLPLLLLFIHFSAKSQTNYPLGIPNCIARWDFAHSGAITSLPDVSGNNNNGTTFNIITANGFRNVPNHAMKFNGSSSYVSITDAAVIRPSSQVTMVALVQLDGYNSSQCQNSAVLSKGYPNFIPGNYHLSFTDNYFDLDCTVYDPTKTQLSSYQGPIHPLLTPGNYVNTGQWYFVSSTYDGANIKYYQVPMDPSTYVSAVAPIETIAATGPIGTNLQNLTIGKHLDPLYPYWFNGLMDEVAIFDRGLSRDEIQKVYDYLWGIVAIVEPFNDTTICSYAPFILPYTVNNSSFFQAGNTFTAQLSDANGSFASPINIGSVVSGTSGSIPCTLNQVPAGTGYRIRIVADNVPYVTRDNGHNININTVFAASAEISADVISLSEFNQQVTFTANPVNCGAAPQYQWSHNGATILGANSSSWKTTVNHKDVVSVLITPSIECTQGGVEDSIVMFNTSIDIIDNFESLTIFPHTNSGNFFLQGNFNKNEIVDIAIYAASGQIIYTNNLHFIQGFTKHNIELPDVANGIYFIRTAVGKNHNTQKFIVQK